jgi:uncharacterized protein (TIGR03435 family)
MEVRWSLEAADDPCSTRTGTLWPRKKAPLSNLVTSLSMELGYHVEDLTGLKGVYSFALEWHTDEPSQTADHGAMLTALRSQLGLNPEPGKGPVQVPIVDSAEKASEN